MKLKKPVRIIGIMVILIAAFFMFKLLGPATKKTNDGFFYVKTGTTLLQLKQQLLDDKVLNSLSWFNIVEKFLSFSKVKPGKYKINSGISVTNLLRMLRNGQQTPVSFVVTKLRTKEQLAGRLGRSFEFDSLAAIQFLGNNDSLKKFGLDTNTVMAAVLPLTYEIKWNTTPGSVFSKFDNAYNNFWTEARKQKAAQQKLTPLQAIILASIVDEETNAASERGNIASTYMNRIASNMPLQADPTVKFALKDFGIKRILFKHLSVQSPYNTYKNRGLPPGPICTPLEATIDAVLDAPKTNYLYFVASPDFNGTHVFTTNYQDHLAKAKEYQQALNERFGSPNSTK
ncbi:MAG TPA: endolytic transglycosylase MltG [Niabella sp.]|nr:endolytic transglycosylase MltG [Niabella sp.]HQW14989.1 endolytic transglycosylase MltG [Niabella sp.]HQX20119.1 endolytic transglycosylase MltG [Niabella sp.]HQX40369.1 endolytic transglycosylase MltG [Niabella sp.]HRB06724.1 endolytic transglycosylase MltG [Niabella sp.]